MNSNENILRDKKEKTVSRPSFLDEYLDYEDEELPEQEPTPKEKLDTIRAQAPEKSEARLIHERRLERYREENKAKKILREKQLQEGLQETTGNKVSRSSNSTGDKGSAPIKRGGHLKQKKAPRKLPTKNIYKTRAKNHYEYIQKDKTTPNRLQQPEGTKGTGIALTPGEQWLGKTNPERVGLAYTGQDKKLSQGQINFYKGLETSARTQNSMTGKDLLKDYRAPKGRIESPEEKEAREKKLARLITGGKASYRTPESSFDQKDLTILEFLANFKYSKAQHIGQLIGTGEGSAKARLEKLKGYGLVNNHDYKAVKIYYPTRAGLDITGNTIKETFSPLTFNPSMFAHNFMVQHIATTLWNNTEDVLLEGDNYPHYNRTDSRGNPKPGDKIISEPSIRSSFGKLVGFNSEGRNTPINTGNLKQTAIKEIENWVTQGGIQKGLEAPENLPGNEWLWTLLPERKSTDLVYHVPDLVVTRPRDPQTGAPNSLLIETERKNGSELSYRKTMLAFLEADYIYTQLIWVCLPGSGYKKIEKIAHELGLLQTEAVKIIPLIKDQKIYTGSIWEI